jgi:plasmid stabilization system protein ParE
VLAAALSSLAEMPERGHSPTNSPFRELPVKFGRYGYAIRYRVAPDEVFVSRIFHVRERR